MKTYLKKIHFLLILLANSWIGATAQSQGWLHRFSATDTLFGVQILPSGYAFLANDATHVYQIRLGPTGQTLDSVALGFVPHDMIPSADGGFFKGMLESPNIRLQKLDAAGALLWEQLLADTLPLKELRLSPLPDGGCYVASVKWFTTPPSYRCTVVRRIAADGTPLWLRYVDWLTGWGTGSGRWINDIVTLPDSSCVVLTREIWDGYHGGSHLFQVKPDGVAGYTAGYGTPWAYASGSEIQTAQPAGNGDLLALGNSWTASSGGHPASVSTPFSFSVSPLPNDGVKVQGANYPPTVSQIGTIYRPQPVAGAPLLHGDMVVVVKQNQEARLWRGSWDLKDSAWERPLTPAGGFYEWKIKRRNRIVYGTPDDGAIIGGADSAGIFIQKIGQWGDAGPADYLPISGHVLEDNDFDCQTPGPYVPAIGAHVRLTCTDNPALRWFVKTDASGSLAAFLPPGHWRAEVVDSIGAIYGKNCVKDTLFTVADTLPVPEFMLPVLRYKARLFGRVGIDYNSNCVLDEIITNYTGPKLYLTRDSKTYSVTPDGQGYFDVAVDTGKYQLRLGSYVTGMFSGFYCQPTEAYIPDYQSADTVTVLWSQLKNCNIRAKVRRDLDYNCSPAYGEQNWYYMPVLLEDAATGGYTVWVTDNLGWIDKPVYGPGDLHIGFMSAIGDSMSCTPALPHTFNFHFAENDQTYTDTLVAQMPRLHDTLIICRGKWAYGQIITKDTVIKTTASFLGNYFPIQTTHHVFVLDSYTTNLYVVDTTLTADSLQIFYYQAANGCDSTVLVHFLTSGTKDIGGASRLHISPNPSTGNVTLQFPVPDVGSVLITDPAGEIIRTFDLEPGFMDKTLSLEGLPPGLYLVRAFRRSGGCFVGKILCF